MSARVRAIALEAAAYAGMFAFLVGVPLAIFMVGTSR